MMRRALAEAIALRLEPHAHLLRDAWGGKHVPVLLTQVESLDDCYRIEADVLLTFPDADAIDIDSLCDALLPPVVIARGNGGRLMFRFVRLMQTMDEASVIVRARYVAEAPSTALLVAGAAGSLTLFASWAPWIGAAHEPMCRPVAADVPDPGETLDGMLP
ncbi:MAG: hypothetical protein ACOY6N_01470 [Pseudomonadota bacterium]